LPSNRTSVESKKVTTLASLSIFVIICLQAFLHKSRFSNFSHR
jgi:hypothetical protein